MAIPAGCRHTVSNPVINRKPPPTWHQMKLWVPPLGTRAEPTSGMSSSWARRLPPKRPMFSLPCEVSLDGERREQQAVALHTAKNGRKPKKRPAGSAISTYVCRAKCMRVGGTIGHLGMVQGLTHEDPLRITYMVAVGGAGRAAKVEKEFDHLTQTGTIADYIKRFKELKGNVLRENVTLSDKYFISCFIGGLTDSLQSLVKAYTLLTIREAIANAKFHEATLKSIAKNQNFRRPPQVQCNSEGAKPQRELHPVKKVPTCYHCGP
ncbi:hypothetical protein EJ110_NYTH60176 [Nymphaea thermarum]|nr:hypothetical protein EJ110_NYTH60176 [Nymphaea thermarum]